MSTHSIATLTSQIVNSKTAETSTLNPHSRYRSLQLKLSAVLQTLAVAAATPLVFAQSSLTFPSAGSSLSIPATLLKPEGDGPFPAVVVMHDCSGLGPRSSGMPARWGKELWQLGYVVLIPDSFTPRGVDHGVCNLADARAQRAVNGAVRATDAYGALAALRSLPFVEKHRVGILGASHGGWSTLQAMVRTASATLESSNASNPGFAAAIALYPSCAVRYGEWSAALQHSDSGPRTKYSGVYRSVAPTLILAGEKDDWTPAEPCRIMVEVARAQGEPIDIRIYPDAHHSFDNDSPIRYIAQRNNPGSPMGRGATTGGNPEAWADARKQVAEFFGTHLNR